MACSTGGKAATSASSRGRSVHDLQFEALSHGNAGSACHTQAVQAGGAMPHLLACCSKQNNGWLLCVLWLCCCCCVINQFAALMLDQASVGSSAQDQHFQLCMGMLTSQLWWSAGL
jgi:hypothetical protein